MDSAVVVEGLGATGRAVDELVGEHERAGAEVALEATDGAGTKDLTDADLTQCPEVGPVGDAVGRVLVVAAVPREEGDPATADVGHRDRVGWLTVRGVNLMFLGAFEQ
jgi:hypothetical protein